MCTSTAQAHKVWGQAADASSDCDCALVAAPCAFWYMVVTFRGRRKRNLVLAQGIGAVLLRNAVFVADAALWTWW